MRDKEMIKQALDYFVDYVETNSKYLRDPKVNYDYGTVEYEVNLYAEDFDIDDFEDEPRDNGRCYITDQALIDEVEDTYLQDMTGEFTSEITDLPFEFEVESTYDFNDEEDCWISFGQTYSATYWEPESTDIDYGDYATATITFSINLMN